MGAACAVGIVLMLVVFLLQKILTAATQWSELSRGKRVMTRGMVLALAGTLYVGLDSMLLAGPLVAMAVPWGALLGLRDVGGRGTGAGVVRVEREFESAESPLS